MILVGSQRGGSGDLARHLLKQENEHVELHQLRGFAADTLPGALNESYAISRATRCRQHLFSLSLNPPPGENVPTRAFEDAIDRIEDKLGLTGQPRAIVFHEKEGRRHCHAVWSRIDAQELKAVPLPFTRTRLQEMSRALYLEHGWKMPRGLATSQERDPRCFTLAEWQQAKRTGQDARQIKTDFQDAWALSDSRTAFAEALKARGYRLARGDKRGFVAVDYRGEVYAVARQVGVKTKALRERLGDEAALPGVTETKAQIAKDMIPALERLRREQDAKAAERRAAFEERRKALVERQRAERKALSEAQERRQAAEARLRQERFRKGIAGLWDRLRGEYRRLREQSEREAIDAVQRDRAEKDVLIFHQLEQRQRLGRFVKQLQERQAERSNALSQDIDAYAGMQREATEARESRREEFKRRRRPTEERAPRPRSRDAPVPER